MKWLHSNKIKPFIKRIFPFVKFRWRIYSFFIKIKPFFYNRFTYIITQDDLSQNIVFGTSEKLKMECINKSNKDIVIKFGEENYNRIYKSWWNIYFKNNYNGFIAKLNGNIIGYVWWVNSNMKHPPEVVFYNIKLRKDEVYGFNFFIAPRYRGRGNAFEFMNQYTLELKKLGFKRRIGIVAADNSTARWIYKVMEHKEMKSATSKVFFNLIAYCEKALFIKNLFSHANYHSGYRRLLSFR